MAASTVGELQTITAKAAADAVTAAGESEIKCSVHFTAYQDDML